MHGTDGSIFIAYLNLCANTLVRSTHKKRPLPKRKRSLKPNRLELLSDE